MCASGWQSGLHQSEVRARKNIANPTPIIPAGYGSSRPWDASNVLKLIENELPTSVALGSKDHDVTINDVGHNNDVLDVGILHIETEIQFRYLFRMVWKRSPGLLIFPNRNS